MKEQVRALLIPLSRIQPNEGQLPGLPKNPREIHDPKYEKLKADIEAYPELLELRGLMVYPLEDGNYITIGGNMRLRALNELGYKEAPCVVIPADTPVERLKAYVILDNGDFGRWDWDALANEWDEEELIDWGVDLPTNYGDFDFIDDLDNDGLKGQIKAESDEFAITLLFPKSNKIEIEDYIKSNGKDAVVKIIMDEICPTADPK